MPITLTDTCHRVWEVQARYINGSWLLNARWDKYLVFCPTELTFEAAMHKLYKKTSDFDPTDAT